MQIHFRTATLATEGMRLHQEKEGEDNMISAAFPYQKAGRGGSMPPRRAGTYAQRGSHHESRSTP
jgi:hypothetical protein